MTRICAQSSDFAASSLRGLALAHADRIRLVRGGVVRRARGGDGKVALVVGGGSGHYPAFAGYVGAGFADAAVAGDIFASPSTQAILNVAREADHGGGIILGFGNYAGDVLNFGIAAERLRGDGRDVRVLATTDDVASAGPGERASRRGIAGDWTVFRIVGAAADAGLGMDDVFRIGVHANAWTSTFGVAFDGCTLPGEREKLFTVPPGLMALGLGVHGEPGIAEQDIPAAPELARLLVERVLQDAPDGVPKRAAVLLNGLGSTKQEELFVLWELVAQELAAAGIAVVAPLVGEYITSLDMAGCSLTLTWLDTELERFWRAAISTPALTRDAIAGDAELAVERPAEIAVAVNAAPTEDGARGGACIERALAEVASALAGAEHELGRIDAEAGDGDHGQGMARGSAAALATARTAAGASAGARSVLAAAADAWADRAGGTSGALWGEGLRAFSAALDDGVRPDGASLAEGAARALARMMEIGRAKPGDKTLIDAAVPFVETLRQRLEAGDALVPAWRSAAEAAQLAADGTRALAPRLGRARNHAERSRGRPDAGAVSFALMCRVVGEFLGG